MTMLKWQGDHSTGKQGKFCLIKKVRGIPEKLLKSGENEIVLPREKDFKSGKIKT